MKKKRLITSALPYVNNIPHLGNIIGCVLSADVFARYCKSAGYETRFICGNDEYGTTTVTKALQENLSPKALCDKYHEIQKDIYNWFEIDFSAFGRTSHEKQTEIVQAMFKNLYDNGYIIKDILVQPFCEHDELFLADRFVEGTCPHCKYEAAKGDQCENCGKLLNAEDLKEPKCTICGNKPVFKETKHLFLDLGKIKPRLEAWINEASEKGHWSHNALSVTKGWLEQGLMKRCITRDLKWGVPVPIEEYSDKVFYVWFDAPIGYISITAAAFDDWEAWWKNPDEVELYQFMGKDNIPFHTVIFPSSLIGSGDPWTMLKHISSTEYLNYEDLKFSKSRGTGIFGDHAKETGIEADLFRYYLLRNRPEKNDTQFYWNDFMEKANGEIIANYANLVNRVLQFIDKFFDSKIPAINVTDDSLLGKVNIDGYKKEITDLFEEVELKKALMKILDLCSEGNKYFQDSAPWVLVKNDKEKAAQVLGNLSGFVKDVSILLWPFIPKAVEQVFDTLNLGKERIVYDDIGNYSGLGEINKPTVLFKKIDKKHIEKLREKYSGTQKEEPKPEEIFSKLHLKVGKIIEVEKHPEADKLYIEKIDMGNGEVRQVVSGLVKYYQPEELLNKKVILAYNLKPAVLRGTNSEGMLLAAETKKKDVVEVISPDCEVGEVVTIDGATPSNEEITIDVFFSAPMKVKDYKITFMDKELKVNGKPVTVEKVEKGKVG